MELLVLLIPGIAVVLGLALMIPSVLFQRHWYHEREVLQWPVENDDDEDHALLFTKDDPLVKETLDKLAAARATMEARGHRVLVMPRTLAPRPGWQKIVETGKPEEENVIVLGMRGMRRRAR